MTDVNDFDRERERTSQNVALMKLLDARSRQTETYSSEDARALLGMPNP